MLTCFVAAATAKDKLGGDVQPHAPLRSSSQNAALTVLRQSSRSQYEEDEAGSVVVPAPRALHHSMSVDERAVLRHSTSINEGRSQHPATKPAPGPWRPPLDRTFSEPAERVLDKAAPGAMVLQRPSRAMRHLAGQRLVSCLEELLPHWESRLLQQYCSTVGRILRRTDSLRVLNSLLHATPCLDVVYDAMLAASTLLPEHRADEYGAPPEPQQPQPQPQQPMTHPLADVPCRWRQSIQLRTAFHELLSSILHFMLRCEEKEEARGGGEGGREQKRSEGR